MTDHAHILSKPIQDVPRWRFTLRQLFWWISVTAVLLAALHYGRLAFNQARQASRNVSISHDFKQVIIGIQTHDDIYRTLPPAVARSSNNTKLLHDNPRRFDPSGAPLYSWRFALVHLLESNSIPCNFSHAWNTPSNAAWRGITHPAYCKDAAGDTNTNMVAVVGPGTAWGDGTTLPLSLEQIPHDTILIVQVRKSNLHWMEPGDFDLRTMPRTINAPDGSGISGGDPAGVFIGLADGSVRFVPSDTPFETLAPFFTIAGAEAGDLDEVLNAQ